MKEVSPLALAAVAITLFSCPPQDGGATTQLTQAEGLVAFAKLYGYVRYFHPSDEAARVDYDRFAVHGARRIAAVQDRTRLRPDLERLFLPLAPTLCVYAEGEEPDSPPRPPAVSRGETLVAWQHRCVGLGRKPYRGVRVNRPEDPLALSNSDPYSRFSSWIWAT